MRIYQSQSTSRQLITAALITTLFMSLLVTVLSQKVTAADLTSQVAVTQTLHKTITIDEVEIFYREAGPVDAPTILLLHGFPTSSHMFRNLIPALADRYHVLAPDYPGFGNSAQPEMEEFSYTFDNLAKVMERFTEELGITKYSLYLMDYGAPIGFRLAEKHPERIDSLIVQNGNAYEEGLREFWDPIKAYWAAPTKENGDKLRGFFKLDATKWQFTQGTQNRPEGGHPAH